MKLIKQTIQQYIASTIPKRVVYLDPGEHCEMEGTIVGVINPSSKYPYWEIFPNRESIPDDWEDKEELAREGCAVELDDPRQLVTILDDEFGQFLLEEAIAEYCKRHKVSR